MNKRLLKIAISVCIIFVCGMFGVLPISVLAATPADQTFDGKSGSGTNSMTLDGIIYTTDSEGDFSVSGSSTLTYNPASTTTAYSGNALTNDFSAMCGTYIHTPTFFQISSANLIDNFKMNSMYFIINDINSCGHSINIEGLDGGKDGTVVASAYGVDMSASGNYGTTDIVTVANEINDTANGEYGGVLTFGNSWNDIDTIVITNNAGDTKAVYAVVDSLDFSNVVDVWVSNAAAANEGETAKFMISLSKAWDSPVTVNYTTADNTAKTADGDYTVQSGTATIPAGSTFIYINVPVSDDTDYETDEIFYLNLTNPSVGGITDSQGEGTINANDSAPTVTLSTDKTLVAEDGGVATLTATLSNKSYQPVTVNLSYSGTATSGADYTKLDSIVIPAGNLSGTVTIAGVNDTTYEGNEMVTADITSVLNGTENATPQQVTASITDDETEPTVSLSVSPLTFSENAGIATVTASLSNKSYQDVTVALDFKGTAVGGNYTVSGTNYTAASKTLVIPAGSLSNSITLTSIDNLSYTGDKTAILDISAVTNGTENGTQQVTATIAEDDSAPSVTLSKSAGSLTENGGSVTLTATLSGTSIEDITVNLAYTGTATGGTDYTAANSIIIPAGNLSGTATITGADDTHYEAVETVIADITSVTGGVENGTQQQTVTITDNDSTPSVDLSISGSSFSETAGTVTITAELSNISYQPVTVNLSYSGTATSGTDYTKSNSVVIPAGSLSGTVTITRVDDTTYEGNETVIADISGIINGTVGSTYQVTTTITDDETAPTASLSILPLTFSENVGVATITATLSNKSYQNVTVDLVFSGTAYSGINYTESATTITIPAGSLTGTVDLTAINNTEYTGDKTVIVEILTVTNGTENGTQQVTAALTEDDPKPSVTLSKSAASLTENGGSMTLTATLSGTSIEDITVNLGYTGTATGGTDYIAANSIIIPAGSLYGTATIIGADDTDYEAAETIIADITSVTGGVENGTQQQTTTITDDDAKPTVTLSTDKTSVSENGETATITATLSNKSYEAVTVELDFTGTADDGIDYAISPLASPVIIVIPAGSLSGTVTITGVDDTTYEGNETVIADISGIINGTVGSTYQVTATITDDETAPIVSLSASPLVFSENAGVATVTATLSNTSYQNVTVNLSFLGTATATDYTASGATITIPAGSLSNSITLTGKNDTDYEGNETVIAAISSITNGTENGTQQLTATINDDDPAPSVTLSVSGSPLNENGGIATITATLSALSTKVITVELGFSGTASTTDYDKSLGGVITIPAGILSGTLTLTGKDDVKDEDNETIIVDIASVTGGIESGEQKVTATTTDDDAAPSININSPSVVEGDTGTIDLIYAVTLSEASDKTVTVDYATADGTATIADNDYIAKTTTTLTFAPGETSKTITVSVNGDTVLEANELVLVKLSNPVNVSIAAGQDLGTGTITNNDNPIIKVSGNNGNIANGDTTPSSLDYTDFGSTAEEGGTVTREFVIGNDGNTTLVLSGISPYIKISGANMSDFSVVTGPAVTIASGGTTTFTIKFDPSSSGIKTARITFSNNEDSNNPFEFDIKGEGTDTPPPPTSTPTPTPTDDKVDVIFDGNAQKAATAKVEQKGGVKTTTVTLDDAAVQENLDKMFKANPNGKKKIIIPVNNKSNIVIAKLNGQTVKNMEDKAIILEIKTENITYTLPAANINIGDVLKQVGKQIQLQDIKVSISIASQDIAKVLEDEAKKNSYQLVAKPVEFEITCTSGNKTVEVSKFNSYVERTVSILEGIDPSKITTGVVLNKDGTFSHVPTAITIIDGKQYAKINSLTNSTYTVIWNPITFKDVEKHWSKSYVNEIGSRLIDSGVGNGNFAPNKSITRAEFASMIVKALGLKSTNLADKFSDVKESDSYYSYIYTAYEYGILQGYTNGKFGPQDLITREQAMTMLSKAMKIAGINGNVSETEISKQLKQFKDSDNISSYAKQAASICTKYSIFAGNTKGKLTPKDNFTRAESATVIIKLLKKAKLI